MLARDLMHLHKAVSSFSNISAHIYYLNTESQHDYMCSGRHADEFAETGSPSVSNV